LAAAPAPGICYRDAAAASLGTRRRSVSVSIWFDLGSIWFDLVRSGSIWFDLVRSGSIWFDLDGLGR
jgi:hypothetical protein